MEIKHTEAFDLAYRFATETNLNIFLTGKAGTGKTTFLKYLREHSVKNLVVTAPTGVAAINAGGITLHSFFQLPFIPFIPPKDLNGSNVPVNPNYFGMKLRGQKLKILRNLELLVIDETSMVAAHTIDAIDSLLKSVRRNYAKPFGGVQVLFIGDLHQLQPVIKDAEWEILKNYYPSIFFFDSLILRENPPITIELKEIFRQRDESFIDALNQIRNNELNEKNFNLLNSRLRPDFNFRREEGYITLTTHNSQAEEINKKTLLDLPGKSRIFKAEISGEYSESQFPAEKELELKKGAQVMFLKNDSEGKNYFNGKIGTIVRFEEEVIIVKCKGEESEITVTQKEWPNNIYALDSETSHIVEKQIGNFSQFPLRLAWAITIHKSQGLTFEKVIIDAERAFVNGQVYVALSRCTSLEGLVLTSPLNRRFLGATEKLKGWLEINSKEEGLADKFQNSKLEFWLNELRQIFSFDLLGNKLAVLLESLQKNDKYLDPGWTEPVNHLQVLQKELNGVSAKFQVQIEQLLHKNSEIDENKILQERIKAAAGYFHSAVSDWKDKFHSLPLRVIAKPIALEISDLLNDIEAILFEDLHKLKFCQNGFIVQEYLKKGKRPAGEPPNYKNIFSKDIQKQKASGPLLNPELYKILFEFRNIASKDERIPLYMVYSNKTIENICHSLPGNLKTLRAINGFGESKIKKYGNEILTLIINYCEQKGLQPSFLEKEMKPKPVKASDSIEESATLLKAGKTIPEIAIERNFAIGTIESHLAKALKFGLVTISELMTEKEFNQIAELVQVAQEKIQLSDLKSKLPDEISFGKIRMAVTWLELKKENFIEP